MRKSAAPPTAAPCAQASSYCATQRVRCLHEWALVIWRECAAAVSRASTRAQCPSSCRRSPAFDLGPDRALLLVGQLRPLDDLVDRAQAPFAQSAAGIHAAY